MKTHLLVLSLFFLLFTSCNTKSNQELSDTQIMDLKMSQKKDHPAEIVPTDHPILLEIMRQEREWMDMYTYFNEQLSNYKEEPYFDNLLTMKTLLIRYPGVNDIPADQLKAYLEELIQLDRITNFESVAGLLSSSGKLTAGDKSYIASALLQIDNQYLERSSPSFKDLQSNNESYLAAVKLLEDLVKS